MSNSCTPLLRLGKATATPWTRAFSQSAGSPRSPVSPMFPCLTAASYCDQRLSGKANHASAPQAADADRQTRTTTRRHHNATAHQVK